MGIIMSVRVLHGLYTRYEPARDGYNKSMYICMGPPYTVAKYGPGRGQLNRTWSLATGSAVSYHVSLLILHA